MRVFARVADEGSLAAAPRALDLAPAVVTRLVAELEEYLGARLMNRTTRRLSLTEVGDGYLQRVRQILADVDEAEVVLCASPEYLDRRGRPAHPSQLVDHDTLLPPISDLQRGITFVTGVTGDDEPPGESVTLIPHRPVLSTSHIDTTYAAPLHGLGVAGLPSFVREDALLEHALERVLPAWRLFSITLWAALPSRKHLPARTRALLDFLVRAFGGEDRDPWLAAAGCETQAWPCPGPKR